MGLDMILTMAGGLAVLGALAVVVLLKNRTAYLGPVKEELQKEKAWLRRGEYNAAMVKGRQNLELLLKLVAEKNGIQLDNTAQAVATAKEEEERRNQNGQQNRKGRGKEKKVMTYQQFNRWLSENGYLDRVARWEMNQVRLIGNRAVHENYADKDDAWNQFNYLEDILKTVTEKSQNPKKHHERPEKPGKKGNTAEACGPVKDSAEAEKKKRRRRRKKKPHGEAVSTPTVETKPEEKKEAELKKAKTKPSKAKPEEKKAAEPKSTAEAANTAADPAEAEKKKRRRRRRRKPQSGPEGKSAAGTIVPEDKNENI